MAAHYNRARPPMSLGPGVPEPEMWYPADRRAGRHAVPADADLVSEPIPRRPASRVSLREARGLAICGSSVDQLASREWESCA